MARNVNKGEALFKALSSLAHFLARLVIGLYFIALSMAFVEYPEGHALFARYIPGEYEEYAFVGFFFLGGYLLIIGWFQRINALLLAISIVWANGLVFFPLETLRDYELLLPDLAFAAALLVISVRPVDPSRRVRRAPAQSSRQVAPARITHPKKVRRIRPQEGPPLIPHGGPLIPMETKDEPAAEDNLFRDVFGSDQEELSASA